MKKINRVLGIMSGTSVDGIDYALCEISQTKISLKKMWSVPFTKDLAARITAAAHDELSTYQTAQLHHDLGRYYADHAPAVNFDYIGLHGQTIFHNPDRRTPATYQIGEPSYLAARFRKAVLTQFRNMDLALGGQGAPLATLFHTRAFSHREKTVAVNNVGGISNVTYLSPGKKVMAFDTGPGNNLIDKAAQKYFKKSFDSGGILASRGIPNMYLVEKWISSTPYILEEPPKSTGRELFNEKYFAKVLKDCVSRDLNKHDIMATLTMFTAKSIVMNYEKFFTKAPDRVVVCGGGAKNPTLLKMLRTQLDGDVEVMSSSDLGWPPESIEASAFALLAYQTWHAQPGNVATATGAKQLAVLGQLTPPPQGL